MKFMVNSIYKTLLGALMIGGFLLGGQVAMALGYHEYENPPCYDITRQTMAVLVPPLTGVNNGGIMNFDDAGVDMQYQACVRMNGAGPSAVPVRLEGWVWNDNLGWVSMYCNGSLGGDGILGTGDDVIGNNLGIPCGAQPYSVLFSPTGVGPDFSTMSMSGNAWGDNIGYISFKDVTSGSVWNEMRPISSGSNRGLVSSLTPSDVHAWADSVGWLDFTGVKFRWEAETVIPQVDDVKIWDAANVCDLATGCSPTVPNTPVADGGGAYSIEIPFNDGATTLDNTQVEDCGSDSVQMYQTIGGFGKPYCARIKLEWFDNVDYNQVTSANQNGDSNPYALTTSPTGVGAVIKPINDFTLYGANFTYNAIKKIWGTNVKSYAPTSDRNVADGMQLEKFFYADSYALAGDTSFDFTKTDQDRLKLAKVNLMLFKYSTGPGIPGQCIMGDVKDPVPPIGPPFNPYTCTPHTYLTDVNMPFRPLYEIEKLVHKVGTKELSYINIENVEAPQYFEYKAVKNSAAAVLPLSFGAQLYIGLAAELNYQLKFDDGTSVANIPEPAVGIPSIATLTGLISSTTPGESFSGAAEPYLSSYIRYRMVVPLPQGIAYYANKLPRISAGVLKNPVAKVQGNVYLTDYAAKTSDVSLRSLGNISSNLRREEITRNVQKYLRGFPVANIVTTSQTVSANDVSLIGNLTELVDNKVFYLRGANLTIKCGGVAPGKCAFDRDVTFIVENGNIFVNSDIVPAAGVQVGLIALRNLDGDVQNQGFLYLNKDVTLLSHVQIYLDRVLQSYDNGFGNFDPINGFWQMPGNDLDRQATFKNQVVLAGTLSSMNGIGNASSITPTDERGGSVSGASCASYNNVTGICRARAVDLNYLRYYGPGLETCTGLEVGGTWLPLANVPRDQQLRGDPSLASGCNPNAPGYVIDGMNYYDEKPGYGDLVSGEVSGGKASLYFSGQPASKENQYPVNFFYVPISKDLAGFEQAQEFNPVIQ